jgi:tRNA (guanine37-N1)-methyltransferase
MTTFHIVTLFPESLDSYLNASILKRAQEKGLIAISITTLAILSQSRKARSRRMPTGEWTIGRTEEGREWS